MKKSLLFLLGCIVLSSPHQTYGQIHHQDLASFLTPSTPGMPNVSAHRGGRYYHGLPENSLSLFKYVTSAVPVFVECDIQMSKDSVFFLLHDDSLNRTTTGMGLAVSRNWAELQQYSLIDDYDSVTTEKIPGLEDVFRWAKGHAILVLDMKDNVPIELLVELIRESEMENDVLLIAYTLEEAVTLHEYAPDLVLSVSMTEVQDITAHADAGIPLRQCVAFTGTRLQSPELYRALRENGILSILGTMNGADLGFRDGDDDVYTALFDAGVDILATDYPIEAGR